jgi:hypothetical protein
MESLYCDQGMNQYCILGASITKRYRICIVSFTVLWEFNSAHCSDLWCRLELHDSEKYVGNFGCHCYCRVTARLPKYWSEVIITGQDFHLFPSTRTWTRDSRLSIRASSSGLVFCFSSVWRHIVFVKLRVTKSRIYLWDWCRRKLLWMPSVSTIGGIMIGIVVIPKWLCDVTCRSLLVLRWIR